MTVSVESVATRLGTGRGRITAHTPMSTTATGPTAAVTSRRPSVPGRRKPHRASPTTHTARNAFARSRLRNVSASRTFEIGASSVYSTGRTKSASRGGAPVAASTGGGTLARGASATRAINASAIGWRRKRFTRTILGMKVRRATALALLACAVIGSVLACKQAPRARPRPPDAGTLVAVYLPPKTADRLAGRLQVIAAQHQWALSIRTDTAATAGAA